MATDLIIILIAVYAAFVGKRRGLVLVAFELLSFTLAATAAFALYQLVGGGLRSWLGISLPLADVAAFIVTWITVELAGAMLVHFFVIPKLTHKIQYSKVNIIGGSIGSVIRSLVLVSLALIVVVGLPISAAAKQPITNAALAKVLLSITGGWQNAIARGLGQDLNSSLTTFTVKADPESTEKIQLGFTTTNVKPDPSDEITDLGLVNHERTSRGLPALTINTTAQAVARAYATRMFADGVFSHIDPEGNSPFDRMKAAGIKFNSAGENLALGPTIMLAHQGLMNSPGHKANILNTSYNKVGIGVIDGGQYGLMVVQDFTD